MIGRARHVGGDLTKDVVPIERVGRRGEGERQCGGGRNAFHRFQVCASEPDPSFGLGGAWFGGGSRVNDRG